MSDVCEECGENAAKYKCPGCGLRSCGLICVRAHKQRRGCNGKRDPTAFVRICDFDDKRLVSDYNFLEEALRAADVAKRSFNRTSHGRKNDLKDLLWQSRCRKTRFLHMAKGMSRRTTNTTHYSKKLKRIYWRLEWIFDSTDVRFIDECVDEHESLGKVLEKHLSPGQNHSATIRHQLRDFIEQPLDQLKLLYKKELCGEKELYFELNTQETLREQLSYKTVVEFPVIKVVLPGEIDRFSIAEDPRPPKAEQQQPSKAVAADGCGDVCDAEEEASKNGTRYREEEINEDDDMEMFNLLDDLPGNAALLWKSMEMQPPTLMGYEIEDGEIS